MTWYSLSFAEIIGLLKSSKNGLDNSEAAKRLHEFGLNQLEENRKSGVLRMLLKQFSDFMILLLLLAALIAAILGDITDSSIILIIVILNAFIGFIQHYRADKVVSELKKIAENSARVLRNGSIHEILATELVPGDIIKLEAGNTIPADVRFFQVNQLKVDESALTGESEHIEKKTEKLVADFYALGDQINMGFKGTHVTNGNGMALVVATGMQTEIGKIARLINTTDTTSPLQKKLNRFGKNLSVIILLISSFIFLFGWFRGEKFLTMLLTSISLSVAAIPEALPALVTITLAFGAKNLAKKNVLIRQLPAVETLGSVTFICSDKTGTLTENKMSVVEIYTIEPSKTEILQHKIELITAMALNTSISFDQKGNKIGDSTEIALYEFAVKKNKLIHSETAKYPRIGEIPFDSSRKTMTTLHENENGVFVITKGAVEVIVDKLNEEQKKSRSIFIDKSNEMAEKGMRVLAFAVKKIPFSPENLIASEMETDLTFIGLVGLMDPPRKSAKKAVNECKKAGIIPVMVTGDHLLTAKYIAKQIKILDKEDDLVLTGTELAEMPQKEFEEIVEKVRVYARMNPEQKLIIVKALQSKNQLVAMTGDGVNDAPALKIADIGIAMGINGTEVSKEAAHMILLDDNFSSIVYAIKTGRKIVDNISKFIKYILAGNFGEIWVIFLAPLFGLPLPLLAIHILWINLITDGLPGLALAAEKPEATIMSRPPIPTDQKILNATLMFHVVWVGFLIGSLSFGMQVWTLTHNIQNWQTMVFSVLCFSQIWHVMAIRSSYASTFKIGFFSNKAMVAAISIAVILQLLIIYIPFFNRTFQTNPLSTFELLLTVLVSSTVFWLVEAEKFLKRKNEIKIKKKDNEK